MVLSDAFTTWCAKWELAVRDGDVSNDPIMERGEQLRLTLVEMIERTGPGRIALALAGSFAGPIVAVGIPVRL